MKQVLVFFVMLPCIVNCQSLPINSDGKVEYSSVVQLDSITDNQLFSRAKMCINDLFRSGKDVTQLIDDATKTVIAKGISEASVSYMLSVINCWFRFQLKISCKDGRYKYVIDNIIFCYQGAPGAKIWEDPIENEKHVILPKKKWADVKQQWDEKAKRLTAEIIKNMNSNKNDNW